MEDARQTGFVNIPPMTALSVVASGSFFRNIAGVKEAMNPVLHAITLNQCRVKSDLFEFLNNVCYCSCNCKSWICFAYIELSPSKAVFQFISYIQDKTI